MVREFLPAGIRNKLEGKSTEVGGSSQNWSSIHELIEYRSISPPYRLLWEVIFILHMPTPPPYNSMGYSTPGWVEDAIALLFSRGHVTYIIWQ